MGMDLEPWEDGYDDQPRCINSDNPTMLLRYDPQLEGLVTVATYIRCLLALAGPDYWGMAPGFWDIVADTVL